jgi:hypothetical protein
MSNGTWPATTFQSGSSLGTNAWGVNNTNNVSTGRLDSPAAVRAYIEERSKQLPPTPESLEQIAKEVTAQGGIIAIATHMGGTKQSDDAIILEDGSCIDLIGSVGSADAKWQWLHHGESYGSTYDPSRNVVDPATGEFKTWGEFISGKGRPVPPFVPMIDSGSPTPDGAAATPAQRINHLEGWGVDAQKVKKRMDELEAEGSYEPMKNFEAGKLNDKSETSPMYYFARWMQAAGLEPTAENLQKFLKANPDWEMDAQNNIRIKPEALSKYPGQEDAGQWHQAISNDGTGPAWDFKPIVSSGTGANENVVPFSSSSRRPYSLRA